MGVSTLASLRSQDYKAIMETLAAEANRAAVRAVQAGSAARLIALLSCNADLSQASPAQPLGLLGTGPSFPGAVPSLGAGGLTEMAPVLARACARRQRWPCGARQTSRAFWMPCCGTR